MRQKRLFIILAVLAMITLVGGTAAFAAGNPARSTQATAGDEAGLVIVSVDPDGPAAAAGVRRGDILLSIGGQETNDMAGVAKAVEGLSEGDEVEVVVTHGDDERTFTLTVGDQDGQPYLGIRPYFDIESQAMSMMDMVSPTTTGAVVEEVVADSPAETAGLEVGDVIISVNGKELDADNSLADAIGALQPGDDVTLELQRDGEQDALALDVTLGENPDKAGVAFLGVRYSQQPTMMFRGGRMGDDAMPFFHGGQMPNMETMPGMPEMPFFNDKELPFDLPFQGLDGGVVISSVAEDSPAAGAGLEKGDLILAVDGETVETPEDVAAIVGDKKPGDAITLSVQKPGDETEAADVEVTLGARSDDDSRAFLGVSLGVFRAMQLDNTTPGESPFRFEVPSDQGQDQSGQEQPQSPLDLLQQLFPGLTNQQNS